MRKKFIIKIITFFIIFIISSTSFSFIKTSEEEQILFFSSAISLMQDGGIQIHETIVVDCLNIEINHGIYRDLPLFENSKSIFPKSLGLKIQDGKLDGKSAIFKQVKKGEYLRIYLGDPDIILEKGVHTFEITYTYDFIIKREDNGELLYLNITGNQWNFPIKKCSVVLVFPENLTQNPDFNFINTEGYTGFIGEKGTNYTFSRDKNKKNILYFETNEILNKNEGFTIYVKWLPYFFSNQKIEEKSKFSYYIKTIGRVYSSNPLFIILLFGTLIIFTYFSIVWAIFGKDPKKMKIPPSTQIIENLSPASIRYIWKMGFDTGCITTQIISMASKGYCSIDYQKNEVIIKKINKDISLSEDEAELAKIIFPEDKDSFSFSKSNYLVIQTIIQNLKKLFKDNYKDKYFITNSLYYIIGLLASIFLVIISFISTAAEQEYGFALIWLTFWTAGVIGLLGATKNAWKTSKYNGLGGAVILTIFSFIFLTVDIVVAFFFTIAIKAYTVIIALIFVTILIILNSIYFKLLKRPTTEGSVIYDEIAALRNFLLQIPKDLKDNNQNINLTIEIDKLLPYALALDLENDWFIDLFSNQSSDNFHSYFHSSNFNYINKDGASGYRDLKSFFILLNSSISGSMSSSSSSSSGGGSSGGGSGGGGGGGW